MTGQRRAVRATARFFEDLDRQLAPERGPNGEPSTDLPATDFDRVLDEQSTQGGEEEGLLEGTQERPTHRW